MRKGSPCPILNFRSDSQGISVLFFVCHRSAGIEKSDFTKGRLPESLGAAMATLRWGPAEVAAWATARGVSDKGAKTLVDNHIDGATLMYLDEVGGWHA